MMPAAYANEMDRCIQNCQHCHDLCWSTYTYCVQRPHPHNDPNHLRLLLDCIQICQTSADFMLRQSDLHPFVCGSCAEVCQRCAEDCSSMGDDLQMESCAAACQRCADSCRQMAVSHA